MNDPRPATIFCDIDGTLIEHRDPITLAQGGGSSNVLQGVKEKLLEWDKKAYKIILTTGRKESLRDQTIQDLKDAGIIYDMLIMGIGGGKRYLINDRKPYGDDDFAIAINLERNEGLTNVNI